jgi:acyl transferase domain-containing protein
MRTLRALGVDVFVEIGPQPTLLGMGAGCLPGDQYAWLPSLKKDHPTWTMLLESVARLHVKGAALDWRAFDAPFGRAHTVLPSRSLPNRSSD